MSSTLSQAMDAGGAEASAPAQATDAAHFETDAELELNVSSTLSQAMAAGIQMLQGLPRADDEVGAAAEEPSTGCPGLGAPSDGGAKQVML